MEWFGWVRSLKVTEPWNFWGGRVLKGHKTMEFLRWEGPERSQNFATTGGGDT